MKLMILFWFILFQASQECEITVWSRPWLKTREVTNSVCKKPQNKQVIIDLVLIY